MKAKVYFQIVQGYELDLEVATDNLEEVVRTASVVPAHDIEQAGFLVGDPWIVIRRIDVLERGLEEFAAG